MTTVPSAFDAPPAASIEDEHSVQIGLVHVLREAIRAGENAPRIGEILDQLLTYSDVHFMSEQMLMRLCGYPEYAEHLMDHDRMMEALHGVASRHAAGDAALALREAEEILAWLTRHIANRDRIFSDFYRDWARRTRDSA